MSEILTVTTLTYAATEATTNKDRGVTPIGRPKITSEIMPDKKIKP